MVGNVLRTHSLRLHARSGKAGSKHVCVASITAERGLPMGMVRKRELCG